MCVCVCVCVWCGVVWCGVCVLKCVCVMYVLKCVCVWCSDTHYVQVYFPPCYSIKKEREMIGEGGCRKEKGKKYPCLLI